MHFILSGLLFMTLILHALKLEQRKPARIRSKRR